MNHAFFNDTGARYNAAAAAMIYERLVAWFTQHLARARRTRTSANVYWGQPRADPERTGDERCSAQRSTPA